MSERVSVWPVVNRSGAMYGQVPTTLPVAVNLVSPAPRAIPKSMR